MNRREVLTAASSAGLVVAASAARADNTSSMAGMKHVHEALPPGYAELIAATSACVRTGNLCVSHCLTLLSEGDRELAACARTVRDTIAACSALQELTAANSPHVHAFAKVVADVCSDCAAECHKHQQHSVCRDCEKACDDCKKLCDQVAA